MRVYREERFLEKCCLGISGVEMSGNNNLPLPTMHLASSTQLLGLALDRKLLYTQHKSSFFHHVLVDDKTQLIGILPLLPLRQGVGEINPWL